MNKEINVQDFISKSILSEEISICRQPNMVSNGCAVHVDNGWQLPPAMSCATWYCNGVMMPIPTYICGAIYFPDRAQGFVDLNGTCVKITPPQSRLITE